MAVSCEIKVVKIAAGTAFERYLNIELPRNSRKSPYLRIFFHFFPCQELRRHGHASRDVCWFCLRTDYGTGACINTFLVRGEQGSQWVYTVIARKVDELWWILINNILNCMFVIRLSTAIIVGKWLINHRSPQTIGGEELDFFNWCCKGSSVEIDYGLDYNYNYMDYVLVLAGCFCLHFLHVNLLHFVSFSFQCISCQCIAYSFPFTSIHFLSFPNYILLDYINTSAGPNLYLLPIYKSHFLKNFGNERN